MSSIPIQNDWMGYHTRRIQSNKSDVQKEILFEEEMWNTPRTPPIKDTNIFKSILPFTNDSKLQAVYSAGYKGKYPSNQDTDMYNDFINSTTLVDDILFGLPRGEPIGTDYFKRIEKCVLKKPKKSGEEEEKVLPWKYMFIRTKPKGDALHRMGVGDKDAKDNGLIFSVLEDLLDLDPFRISRMFKSDKKPTLYKNCRSHKIDELKKKSIRIILEHGITSNSMMNII
jgi:hypothetical protein